MSNKVIKLDVNYEQLEWSKNSAITRYVNLFYYLLAKLNLIPFGIIIVHFQSE